MSCPPPGNLPDIGMEPASLMSRALSGGFFNGSVGGYSLSLISARNPFISWLLYILSLVGGYDNALYLYISMSANTLDLIVSKHWNIPLCPVFNQLSRLL